MLKKTHKNGHKGGSKNDPTYGHQKKPKKWVLKWP